MNISKKIAKKIAVPFMVMSLLAVPSMTFAAEDFSGLTEAQIYELGNTFVDKHDYNKAIEAYNRILENNSGWAVVYTKRAKANFLLGNRDEATKDMETAMSLDSSLPDIYCVKGNMLYLDNDFAGAEAQLNKALEIKPDYVEALTLRGKLYSDMNRLTDAIADLSQALTIAPSAVTYVNRAIVFEKVPDISSANIDYNKAIDLDATYAPAYINRGMISYYQRKFKAALGDFELAIKYDPNNANAYTNRGSVYLIEEDYESAKNDFDKAIEIDPAAAMAYNGRGLVNQKTGRYSDALHDFDKCIELAPKYEYGYQNLSLIHI